MSIQQTIYRMDLVSPLVEALKSAAKEKKVSVLIELRARFDELNNLKLADELRASGVEVKFGFGKLKLHAKVALVTRRAVDGAEGGIEYYAHFSTGNYHSATARQYTDLALLTSNREMGLDAQAFFDSARKGEWNPPFKRLVAAPNRLHRRILSLIETEIDAAKQGRPAQILAKVNALVDQTVVERLYEASQAGVQINLIVRGACSLIPGVKGLSENIQVISIVDRFLEHSRIYYFGSTETMYLSSADWMPRNFFSRFEIAFPVPDSKIKQFIESVILPAYLADNQKSRELTSRGTWKSRSPQAGAKPFRCQEYLMELSAIRDFNWESVIHASKNFNPSSTRPSGSPPKQDS